jgi:hypothetical protein
MSSDHHHETELKNRGHSRKEWSQPGDHEHQMEAREHARQPGKVRKAFEVRNDEAKRQIRELRVRY